MTHMDVDSVRGRHHSQSAMTKPKRKSERLADRAREILQGLLDAGDELAAGLFGPPPKQPVMIPVRRRPRR